MFNVKGPFRFDFYLNFAFHFYYLLDIDECASMPCINGDCIDQVGSYQCRCNNAFSGTNCEIGMSFTCTYIDQILYMILTFAIGDYKHEIWIYD